QVTIEEARELVIAAQLQHARRLPGFSVDASRDLAYPRFLELWVHWDGPPGGSVNIGFYDVDPRTGDVWSATSCWEEHTRRLARLQKRLRRRIGLSDELYHRVKSIGPYCEGVR